MIYIIVLLIVLRKKFVYEFQFLNNVNQMTRHILFFSRQCQYCGQVMMVLANNSELNELFIKIEIEKCNPSHIPREVLRHNTLPTMMVDRSPQKLIVGNKNCMKYLSILSNQGNQPTQHPQRRQMMQQHSNQRHPQQQQQQQQQKQQQQQQQKQEIQSAYDTLSGISTKYSFIKKGDEEKSLMSNRYTYLEGNDKSIYSQNRVSQNNIDRPVLQSSKTHKTEMLDKRYEQYMQDRDRGMPQPPKRF
jgi:hypothetical protein